MRYKELLDELKETRTFEVPSHQGEVRVWENPGLSAMRTLKQRFGELRGITFPDGNFWVWRAYDATHHAVKQPNQIDTEAHFYVSGEQPQDEGWKLGTWSYEDGDMKLWIDRQNVPPRLKSMFPQGGEFTPWQTPN